MGLSVVFAMAFAITSTVNATAPGDECLPFMREAVQRTHPVGPDRRAGNSSTNERSNPLDELNPIFQSITKTGRLSSSDVAALKEQLKRQHTYNYIKSFELGENKDTIVIGNAPTTSLLSNLMITSPTSNDDLVLPITITIERNSDGSFSIKTSRAHSTPLNTSRNREDRIYAEIRSLEALTWALQQRSTYGPNAVPYEASYRIHDGKCAPWKIPNRNINAPACLKLDSFVSSHPNLLQQYKTQKAAQARYVDRPTLNYCTEASPPCSELLNSIPVQIDREWIRTESVETDPGKRMYQVLNTHDQMCSSEDASWGPGYNPIRAFSGLNSTASR